MPRLAFLAVLVVGLLTLPACDSADPDPGNDLPDSFTQGQGGVSVTGGINATFTGAAFWTLYQENDAGENSVFIMVVFDSAIQDFDDENFDAVIIGRTGDRPAVGAHDLTSFLEGDENGYDAFFIRSTAQSQLLVISESGSMNVASSSTERVQGSFQFAGGIYSMTGPTGNSAEVNGGFNALYVDPDTVPGGLDDRTQAAAAAAQQLFETVR